MMRFQFSDCLDGFFAKWAFSQLRLAGNDLWLWTCALVATTLGAPWAASGAEESASAREEPSVRLIFFPGSHEGSGAKPVIQVDLAVRKEHRTLRDLQRKTADKVFDFFDFNHDGQLDEEERRRLPSALDLRQLGWGRTIPSARPDPVWTAIKETLARKQFQEIYGSLEGASLSVAYGKVPGTEALHLALCTALDANRDGTIDEKEWKQASIILARWDRNEDGLVSPGELVSGRIYPGASATTLLSARDTAQKPVSPDPVVVGTAWKDTPVALLRSPFLAMTAGQAIFSRLDANRDGTIDIREACMPIASFQALDRDGDGKLDLQEVSVLTERSADVIYEANWATEKTNDPKVSGGQIDERSLSVGLRNDPGLLAERFALQRALLESRFLESDALKIGKIGAKDLAAQHTDLARVLEVADADSDQLLSRKELDRWLDLQWEIAQSQLFLGILDFGHGLFEFLDRDQDGGLSALELQGAWERIRGSSCWKNDRFVADCVPWTIRMTLSQGQPRDRVRPAGSLAGDRPAWFRAMDRNGDGVIAKSEFLGPLAKFVECDLNQDGFLSVAEAEWLRRRP